MVVVALEKGRSHLNVRKLATGRVVSGGNAFAPPKIRWHTTKEVKSCHLALGSSYRVKGCD